MRIVRPRVALGTGERYRRPFVPRVEALQKAVGTDSTFALAYYRLSDAADRAGRPELARSSAGQALRYRQQLGERDRWLIEAQDAWRVGHGGEAESLYRSLVADYPDDVEALIHLTRIASLEGKRQEADSLVRRARAVVRTAELK